jgi:hypothetical protein
MTANTALTQEVHGLATTIAAQTATLEHVNAELNLIRAAVAPSAPNPAAGTDTGVA